MLEGAHERWIEHGTDDEMNLAFLIDEVEAYLSRPWWRRTTSALSAALATVKTASAANGRAWMHAE